MAVGLGFLGRGRGRVAYWYGALHVLGAALAGAVTGGLLGLVGQTLALHSWRPWIIAGSAAVALYWAFQPKPPPLGRQRQVPRRWPASTPLASVYLIWGAMLGSGWYTPVYQSVFIVLIGAQLTAGWQLGLLSGVIFGAVRQVTALYPVQAGFGPDRTMNLLAVLRPYAHRGNLAVIVIGGVALVLVSLIAT